VREGEHVAAATGLEAVLLEARPELLDAVLIDVVRGTLLMWGSLSLLLMRQYGL
jgi:hypothetical protein